MTSRAWRIGCLAAIVALAFLGMLLLALSDPSSLPNPHHERLLILMYGTLFGQTSLTAGWCALGPFSLSRRLAIASIWLAGIIVAVGFNDAAGVHPPDVDGVLTFGAVALCQWTLTVAPMWAIAARWNLGCVANGTTGSLPEHRNRQIGIREAMILTAVVAAVLGTASFRSGELRRVSINWEMMRIFGFLSLASALIGFPLTLCMLLGRPWLRPMSLAVVFFSAGTCLELVLVPFTWPGPRIDFELYCALALVNLVQGAWIVVVVTLLRIGGYELRSRRSLSSA